MSVRIMSAVWQFGPEDSIDRFVLLAIADNANDEGVAWPSVSRLADKCCLGSRATQYRLRGLEADGWISVVRGVEKKGVNRYTINPERLKGVHGGAGLHGGAGVHEGSQGGARRFAEGVHGGAPEPSVEPSKNHQGAARKRTASARTSAPDILTPSAGSLSFAEKRGVQVTPELVENFLEHHRAKGTLFADWQSGLRTWIANEPQYRNGPNGSGQSHLRSVGGLPVIDMTPDVR